MTSSYSSDPRVPPAQVGRLGKHHRSVSHAPVGLPAPEPAPEAPKRKADSGPTYDDFLEHDRNDDELPDKTG